MTKSPFLCPKPKRRRQPLPSTLLPFAGDPTPAEREALRSICENGDLLMVDGRPWLLAPVTPALLDTLAAFEAEASEVEPDAEDAALGFCGHTWPVVPNDDLPGDRDDAEEDDPAGGNVEDQGEVSIGWSDGAGVGRRVDPACQLYLSHGLPIHDDLEDEHDGSYDEPEWEPDTLPVVMVDQDGRGTLPDGSVIQWQALPGEHPAPVAADGASAMNRRDLLRLAAPAAAAALVAPAAIVTPTRQDLIARVQAAVLDLKASYTDADVTADGDLRQLADGILRILDQVFTA